MKKEKIFSLDDFNKAESILGSSLAKLSDQSLYENSSEKAVYLHCNIAKLQPFIDGNKRTARMIESITMMNADIIPRYLNPRLRKGNYKLKIEVTGLAHMDGQKKNRFGSTDTYVTLNEIVYFR